MLMLVVYEVRGKMIVVTFAAFRAGMSKTSGAPCESSNFVDSQWFNLGSRIVVWRNPIAAQCFSLLRRQGSITVHVWSVLVTYISQVCHPVSYPLDVGCIGDLTVTLTTFVYAVPLLRTCGALSPRQTQPVFHRTCVMQTSWQRIFR